MTLPEVIANEVMDAIERERRINKDDLIVAAEVAIGKFKKEQMRAHPLMVADPTDGSLRRILTQQAMTDAVKEYMRMTTTFCTDIAAKPGCISSAEAAQKAACIYKGVEVVNDRVALPSMHSGIPNIGLDGWTRANKELHSIFSIWQRKDGSQWVWDHGVMNPPAHAFEPLSWHSTNCTE